MTDSFPYKQSSPVSAGDLLDLLNIAKVNEYGNGVWPFTMAQLLHFSDPRKTYINYRHKTIPKKSGGVREISSPVWMLKMFQAAAGRMLQSYYEAPKEVMGFVPGRSVVDNASRHTRKYYVLNADLKDFFPSITRRRVQSALMRPPFSFGKEAARLLSGICCAHADIAKNGRITYWDVQEARRYGIYVKVEDNKPSVPATLPQGAPSSPILSNAVCIRLDRRLAGLARRYEVAYSRYADDITFSANHNVFQEGYSFLKEFRKIISDEGFVLNEHKLRLQERGQRQEVTGLVVNRKVNVCRKYIRDIGSLLYIWERYGVDVAYARFLKHNIEWRKLDGVISCDSVIFRPHLIETVQGRLAYLRMVRGKEDPVWSRLNARFEKLKDQYESKGVMGNPVRILHSWTIKRFEQLSGITLRYGDIFGYYDCQDSFEHPHYTRNFYIEKDGYKTYVHPSRYCKTRLVRVLKKGDSEAFERLKSEFRIGLCVMNPPQSPDRLLGLLADPSEEEIEQMRSQLLHEAQVRSRSLMHTFSNMDVHWKIFRRPPDVEDLPY